VDNIEIYLGEMVWTGLICLRIGTNSVNISFWSQPKQNTPHYFLVFNEFQFSKRPKHSALEISDLSELTVHFSRTVAETASNIHILHNHNLGGYCHTPKVSKPYPT
jgi:hypothetical protein